MEEDIIYKVVRREKDRLGRIRRLSALIGRSGPVFEHLGDFTIHYPVKRWTKKGRPLAFLTLEDARDFRCYENPTADTLEIWEGKGMGVRPIDCLALFIRERFAAFQEDAFGFARGSGYMAAPPGTCLCEKVMLVRRVER